MAAGDDQTDSSSDGAKSRLGAAMRLARRAVGRAGALLRKPLWAGFAAAVLSAMVFAAVMPATDDHASALVSIEAGVGAPPATPEDHEAAMKPATDEPAATATTDTKTPPPLTEPAPAADLPVTAEVAIVISDVGLNRRVTEAVDASLPRDTTTAISVYASDPAGMAAAFKQSGRDVWLEVAAQSLKPDVDPGPLAVSSTLTDQENGDLITRQIAMAGGNVLGLYVPDDAEITANAPDAWRDMAMDVIGSNLMILDATTAKVATTLYMQKSDAQINAYLKTDIMVSGALGPAALKAALARAEPAIIRAQQAIVVLDQPTVSAIETLSAWVNTLRSKGIRLVPASKFTGLKG